MSLIGAIMSLLGYLLLIAVGIVLVLMLIAAIPAGLALLAMGAHDKAKANRRADRIQRYRDAMPRLESELMEKFDKSCLTDEIVDFIVACNSRPTSITVNKDEIVIAHGNMFSGATVFRFEDHNIKPISDNKVLPTDKYGTTLSDVGMDYNGLSECDGLAGVLMARLTDHYPGYSMVIGESAMQRGQSICRYFSIAKPVVKKEPERSF